MMLQLTSLISSISLVVCGSIFMHLGIYLLVLKVAVITYYSSRQLPAVLHFIKRGAWKLNDKSLSLSLCMSVALTCLKVWKLPGSLLEMTGCTFLKIMQLSRGQTPPSSCSTLI